MTSMYGGARDPRTGEQIYYGWPKGSENSGRMVKTLPGWSLSIGPIPPIPTGRRA